jgi:hypothetical protein
MYPSEFGFDYTITLSQKRGANTEVHEKMTMINAVKIEVPAGGIIFITPS